MPSRPILASLLLCTAVSTLAEPAGGRPEPARFEQRMVAILNAGGTVETIQGRLNRVEDGLVLTPDQRIAIDAVKALVRSRGRPDGLSIAEAEAFAARNPASPVSAMLIAEAALGDNQPERSADALIGSASKAGSLVQLVSQWRNVVQARLAWQRLSNLLERLPAAAPAMALPAPQGHVAVEGLTAAAAAGGPPMLRHIAFALKPGEVLAVIGPSASGKTTLARMLVGLWPPLAGTVRLDGADISAWNKAELGRHLGYVPQNVELLAGTLAENIARFGDADTAALHEAARAVGLHDWITALPQGYDSPVGDEGVMLSGGQRQRVALARALYGKPAFVVLDEPNASLDEAGNQALVQAIAATKARGATVVVMTHLPGVLAVADKALVLHGGTQRAFGPRDEVMAALQKANQNNYGNGNTPAPRVT